MDGSDAAIRQYHYRIYVPWSPYLNLIGGRNGLASRMRKELFQVDKLDIANTDVVDFAGSWKLLHFPP